MQYAKKGGRTASCKRANTGRGLHISEGTGRGDCEQNTGRDRGRAGNKDISLQGLVFCPEDGYNRLFQNLGTLLPDQTTVSIFRGHQRDTKSHVLR